jgi:putative methyltransferase
MKNIWLVQPSKVLSGAAYLPYSIGMLAAYAWQFEEIKRSYRLKDLLFTMRPINTVLAEMDAPYLVGFSCYMWNVEYNLQLAKAIKQAWPECLILFGGQQIPPDCSYLEQYSFIDILLTGEGERPFAGLLKSLLADGLSQELFSVFYRRNGEIVKGRTPLSPPELDDYPSPYLEGWFDRILQDERYRDVTFNALIETNRGCPYQCLYCSWGDRSSKVRTFPLERVKKELDWIARRKIEYCVCADGNFGLFPRDEEIADYVIGLKKEYGYPKVFEMVADKDKHDRNFRIYKKLHEARLDKGVSMSVQSLTPRVLKNIGRKNMPAETFAGLLRAYRAAGMDTYTDLIIGLPGESYDSFCSSLFGVIEAGQHYRLIIYNCELLPNAPMYRKDVIEKYGIRTVSSLLRQTHSDFTDSDLFASRSDIVVETNTMTRQDWQRINLFAAEVQALHCFGALRFIAIYLRQTLNVPYAAFYREVSSYIEKNGYLRDMTVPIVSALKGFLQGGSSLYYTDGRFGEIYLPFDEGLFLCIAADADRFYKEIAPCLAAFFEDEDVFEDLMLYQKSVLNLPCAQPHTAAFRYDWPAYFADIYGVLPRTPVRRDCRLRFTPETAEHDLKEYARKVVWYGKRHSATVISAIEELC